MKLDKFNTDWFGKARVVTIQKETTTIFDGKVDEEAINNSDVYENTLLTYISKMLEARKEQNKKLYTFNYYTLYKLIRNNIHRLNKFIDTLTRSVLDILSDEIEFFFCSDFRLSCS